MISAAMLLASACDLYVEQRGIFERWVRERVAEHRTEELRVKRGGGSELALDGKALAFVSELETREAALGRLRAKCKQSEK